MAFAKGDIEAFEHIYAYLFDRTEYMIRTFIMDYNNHEDIFQDLMMLTLRLCRKYNPELGHFEHYAYRTFRFELIKIAQREAIVQRIRRSYVHVKKELIDFIDEDIEHLPEDRLLGIEMMRESLEKIESSARFSQLERSVLSGLMTGQSPMEVRETLGLDDSSYTNAFYRMRNKVKYHPMLVPIDNETHNSYSI